MKENVYRVRICVSGEIAVYHKTAPSWQRARHLAIVNAMKDYQRGFAEIFDCDWDVKQMGEDKEVENG